MQKKANISVVGIGVIIAWLAVLTVLMVVFQMQRVKTAEIMRQGQRDMTRRIEKMEREKSVRKSEITE